MSSPGVTPFFALTHRVRWRIYSFLWMFGFIAYLQQKGLTVAADRMMPDLGITQMQIGWLEWAFVLGYAAFQFPGGVIGQKLGARVMFTLIGIVACLATALTPLAPAALHGSVLIGVLFALQLMMGVAQGPIFPVGAGVMQTWFRPERWALINGLQSAALQIAAAATPPLVSYLMSEFGWREALLWPAVPPIAVVLLWAWYARNTPQSHPGVTPEEIAELYAPDHAADPDRASYGPASGSATEPDPPAATAATETGAAPVDWKRIRALVTNRSILLLTLSYVCMNYVFYLIANWCFLYLVQERHFNVLEGGWLATLPPLAAAVGAGVGGPLVDATCARFGLRWGFRLVPMIALPASGLLLLVTTHLSNPHGAVLALALAYLAVELSEGAYWGGTMLVARADTMSATGILNTGGNLGGLIGIPIVAYLSGSGHWTAAFVIGTVFAFVGAFAWLGIETDRRFEPAV